MIVRQATPQDAQGIISLLQAIVDKGGTTTFQGKVPADFLTPVLAGNVTRLVDVRRTIALEASYRIGG